MKKIAFLGGKKAITHKKPHWMWPPSSKEKTDSILKYYKHGEKKNKKGYPEIVEIFEKNFAKYVGAKFALTANSGTSSLHSAFFALDLNPGDEIIAPALTFHATATPIMANNLVPVIADCESDTGNIDPKSIIKKMTSKTRAVVVTHLCGHPCELDQIIKICKKYDLFLVEDCSHAHGSTYKGKKVGIFGDIGVFSLDNKKLLAAGEGGILVTNNSNFYERAMMISDFSSRITFEIKSKKLKTFSETGFGFKHRIHPVSAAIANTELKKINYYIKKRTTVLNYISKKIRNIPGINPPVTRNYVTRGAFFGYRPFIEKKKIGNISINKVIKILQAEGMEVRLAGNKPLHLLPYFSKSMGAKFLKKSKGNYKNYKLGDLPNAEKFYYSTISIPTFTFEKKKLVDEYIEAFAKVFNFLAR